MKLERLPVLHSFLTTTFMDADPERDEETLRTFVSGASSERRIQIEAQLRTLLDETEIPIDELGSEANRWFADSESAREWLLEVLRAVEGGGAGAAVVKDSNGAVLSEGDTVQVIKDLKVKGGSSDLKRGTVIKKIHITGDPEAIECRVDGSTLVLKTCFLKKV